MAQRNSGSFDTNLLLRLILDDVPMQTKSIDALLASGRKFEIADVALVEMIFVLEKIYQMDRVLIQENIFAIIRNTSFVCNRQLFEHALPLYISESMLSIIDCVLLIYARLNKALPLYSFDKKLVKVSQGDSVWP
jgi:predicted nucleic-acid-binding protein